MAAISRRPAGSRSASTTVSTSARPSAPTTSEETKMKKYSPSEEVDFLVIGSGAAGGVMAKQLSQAGFSVVVLEQGSWGAYGHEQDYNKDELSNRFPTEEDMLLSDPRTQRN